MNFFLEWLKVMLPFILGYIGGILVKDIQHKTSKSFNVKEIKNE